MRAPVNTMYETKHLDDFFVFYSTFKPSIKFIWYVEQTWVEHIQNPPIMIETSDSLDIVHTFD